MKKIVNIFVSFFKVGLFTIGGGYAMLPIIEREIVESKSYMEMDEVLECYSLAQSLPGVIASNTAAFVGYRLAGVLGAIAAVLGVILPSILIILSVAVVFQNISQYEWVGKAFKGIRVVVLALLINSMIRLIQKSIKGKMGWLIAVSSFIIVLFLDVSPIWVLLGAGLVGIIYYREQVNH